MKLAVRKDPSSIPLGGFHYLLFPMKMDSDDQAAFFELLGHIVIEVPDERGEILLNQAKEALRHQLEIATLAEKKELETRKPLKV